MTGTETSLLSWISNQGVAIAVLAFVLVRLDARMVSIATTLQQLVDLWRQSGANPSA